MPPGIESSIFRVNRSHEAGIDREASPSALAIRQPRDRKSPAFARSKRCLLKLIDLASNEVIHKCSYPWPVHRFSSAGACEEAPNLRVITTKRNRLSNSPGNRTAAGTRIAFQVWRSQFIRMKEKFIMRSTILFVDHDIKLTDAVARALTARGHLIRACTNGLECVQNLREFAPTVLVLDRELLWGGAEGVLEYLIRDEPLMPPMVVVATNDEGSSLPDHLEPWVDLQIVRPKSLQDLMPFLNQLETLAWWSQSPYRELSPSSSKSETPMSKPAPADLAPPRLNVAPDRHQAELYPSH